MQNSQEIMQQPFFEFFDQDKTVCTLGLIELTPDIMKYVQQKLKEHRDTCTSLQIIFCECGMTDEHCWVWLSHILVCIPNLMNLKVDILHLALVPNYGALISATLGRFCKKLQKLEWNLYIEPNDRENASKLMSCFASLSLNKLVLNISTDGSDIPFVPEDKLILNKCLTALTLDLKGSTTGHKNLVPALHCLTTLRYLCLKDYKPVGVFESFCAYISSNDCCLTKLNLAGIDFYNIGSLYNKEVVPTNRAKMLGAALRFHKSIRFLTMPSCNFSNKLDFLEFFFAMLPFKHNDMLSCVLQNNKGVEYLDMSTYYVQDSINEYIDLMRLHDDELASELRKDFDAYRNQFMELIKNNNIAVQIGESEYHRQDFLKISSKTRLKKCFVMDHLSYTDKTMVLVNCDEEEVRRHLKMHIRKEKLELINCKLDSSMLPTEVFERFGNLKSLSVINCQLMF
jgi:hypothetical protein